MIKGIHSSSLQNKIILETKKRQEISSPPNILCSTPAVKFSQYLLFILLIFILIRFLTSLYLCNFSGVLLLNYWRYAFCFSFVSCLTCVVDQDLLFLFESLFALLVPSASLAAFTCRSIFLQLFSTSFTLWVLISLIFWSNLFW